MSSGSRNDESQDQSPSPPGEHTQPDHISSIASLFLTDIRTRAQSGRERPVRIPPGGAAVPSQAAHTEASEPSSAEFQTVPSGISLAAVDAVPQGVERTATAEVSDDEFAELSQPGRDVYVLVAPHIEDGLEDLATRVAAALALTEARACTLSLRAGGVRLGLIDAGLPADGAETTETEDFSELSAAVSEMSADIGVWVVTPVDIGNGAAEGDAAAVVRAAASTEGSVLGTATWIVPVPADETDMIGAYRTIKTLSQGPRARLVLAAVSPEALPAAEKLRGVMRKFLAWDADRVIVAAHDAYEHPLITWSAGASAGDLRAWRAMAVDLVMSAGRAFGRVTEAELPAALPLTAAVDVEPSAPTAADCRADSDTGVTVEFAYDRKPDPAQTELKLAPVGSDDAEVLEYRGAGDLGVLDSVIDAAADLTRCDLTPPGTLVARLAADTDGRLTLLVALTGATAELAETGRVLAWVKENRLLVARVCSGVYLSPSLDPVARLYIAGEKARHLSGLLSVSSATVHTYRALRWGEKRGLLLEAA